MENGSNHWDGNETMNSMMRMEFLSKLCYLKLLKKKSAHCSQLVRVPLIQIYKNGTNKMNVANRRKFSPCMICGGQRGTGADFCQNQFGFLLSVSFHLCPIFIHFQVPWTRCGIHIGSVAR